MHDTDGAKAAESYTLYYNTTDGKLHKGSESGDVYTSGEAGLEYSGSTTTLTLTGGTFTTSVNPALVLPDNITLTINEDSTVESIYNAHGEYGYAIKSSANLTVNGTAILTATGPSTAMSYGMFVGGTLTVSGSPMLNLNGKNNSTGHSYGLFVRKKLYAHGGIVNAKGDVAGNSFGICVKDAEDDAKSGDYGTVSIIGGTVNATSISSGNTHSCGIKAGMISIGSNSDTGKLTVESGAVDNENYSSYAVYVNNSLDIINGTLEAECKSNTAAVTKRAAVFANTANGLGDINPDDANTRGVLVKTGGSYNLLGYVHKDASSAYIIDRT